MLVETLEPLTDKEIAYVLLHRLWSQYDTGGISNGRSLCAALLEAARRLLPSYRVDTIGDGSLVAEARNRVRRKHASAAKQLLLFPQTLRLISPELIACRLLDDLYEVIHKRHPDDVMWLEQRVVELIPFLLDPEEDASMLPPFTTDELFAEEQSRFLNTISSIAI